MQLKKKQVYKFKYHGKRSSKNRLVLVLEEEHCNECLLGYDFKAEGYRNFDYKNIESVVDVTKDCVRQSLSKPTSSIIEKITKLKNDDSLNTFEYEGDTENIFYAVKIKK